MQHQIQDWWPHYQYIEIINSLFHNRNILIATMHHKDQVIWPTLQSALPISYDIIPWINTDQFGTFSGEKKRKWSMIDATQAKIQLAHQLTNHDLILASEWSFGYHPSFPFQTTNTEVIILKDFTNDYEFRWYYTTPVVNQQWQYISGINQLITTATEWWRPQQWVIIRPHPDSHRLIIKDCDTTEKLHQAYHHITRRPRYNKVYLETDMRAHQNPLRMKAIEQCTHSLLANIYSICPACWSPWLYHSKTEYGLPCERCHQPTRLPLYELWQCQKCSHQEHRSIPWYSSHASAQYCSFCNP